MAGDGSCKNQLYNPNVQVPGCCSTPRYQQAHLDDVGYCWASARDMPYSRHTTFTTVCVPDLHFGRVQEYPDASGLCHDRCSGRSA